MAHCRAPEWGLGWSRMGFFVRAVSRRNVFAVIVGALLAGAPLIAFNFWLDIIVLASGERMVRLRRQVGAGANGVAALVPTALFLPQVSTQGGPFSAYARILTGQGTVIGEVGGPLRAEASSNFVANIKS